MDLQIQPLEPPLIEARPPRRGPLRVDALLAAARDSVGSLSGVAADDLIRDQVRQVRDCQARQQRRPFDRQHYPWGGPNELTKSDEPAAGVQAAGHTPGEPARSVVTAACDATVADARPAADGAGVWLDFAHLKQQLPTARVLDHLGLAARLKGSGAQRRCACPNHRGDGRGRTFSVNLERNQYQCFDARCGSQGGVLDLWSALHQRDLRQSALDLVQVFGLEPSPRSGTEERNG